MLPLAEAVVRIEMQAIYSATVYLEKIALTEASGSFGMIYTAVVLPIPGQCEG
jgi:hypothetical protein